MVQGRSFVRPEARQRVEHDNVIEWWSKLADPAPISHVIYPTVRYSVLVLTTYYLVLRNAVGRRGFWNGSKQSPTTKYKLERY